MYNFETGIVWLNKESFLDWADFTCSQINFNNINLNRNLKCIH